MSDQITPRTYRELLLPIVGAAALSDAESRVYELSAPLQSVGTYMCRDGYCALGVMLRRWPEAATRVSHPHFPYARAVLRALEPERRMTIRRGNRRFDALSAVIRANDRGDLATPGSLTALLDSNVEGVGR